MQKEQKVQLGLLFVLETIVKLSFFVSFFNRFQTIVSFSENKIVFKNDPLALIREGACPFLQKACSPFRGGALAVANFLENLD